MILSVPTTTTAHHDDRDPCLIGLLDTGLPSCVEQQTPMDDADHDKSSIVASAFDFWSDMDDQSCSETELASFSMTSYSSLLGPYGRIQEKTVMSTLNDSWFEKDDTKHALNDNEIDKIIDELHHHGTKKKSEVTKTKKKSKRKDKESDKQKKKKEGSKKVECKVDDEKKGRRKDGNSSQHNSRSSDGLADASPVAVGKQQEGERDATVCKAAGTAEDAIKDMPKATHCQDETEVPLERDASTDSILRDLVQVHLQQKSRPALAFRTRPIGQPRYTPVPNYTVPAGPGPIVQEENPVSQETDESAAHVKEADCLLMQRFSETEGDLYQRRRATGFKDLGLLQHIETCVNIRSNLRPVGDPEVLRKAKLADYMEKFRREKPRGSQTHGLSIVDVQTQLANLKRVKTKHVYGNNLQERHNSNHGNDSCGV